MKAAARYTMLERITVLGRLLGRSIVVLRDGDPLRMAGATAFFTSFALPPIIIILFQLFGLFLNRRLVGTEMMEMLTHTLGKEGAMQIRVTTRGFRTLANNWYTAMAGFLFLVFVATTLFAVIKNSLNDIWKIQVKKRPGLLFGLRFRSRSLAAILLAGMLFLVGIFLDSLEVFAGDSLDKVWQGGGHYFKGALNEVVGLAIVSAWFTALFRFLADGRPSWKASIAGGLLTGFLYSIGKTILSILLINSNIGSLYGASASIVLILLFVFYSSFILYFGASFVKVYSDELHRPIKPNEKAYHYQLRKVE